jgi:hypothetical protein
LRQRAGERGVEALARGIGGQGQRMHGVAGVTRGRRRWIGRWRGNGGGEPIGHAGGNVEWDVGYNRSPRQHRS